MEEGKRFSQVYLERGAPTGDSERFRNRLLSFYTELALAYLLETVRLIEKETGALMPSGIDDFFRDNELRDILDSITLIYDVLVRNKDDRAITWKNSVARVFREENLGYRLDSKCGVHYFIDEEFERNRLSTLTALDDPKLNSVRNSYETAYRYMDNDPPDTKAAVRSIFESLEILVRQMVPSAKNLNRWVVEHTLKETCSKLYEKEPTAKTVVSNLFDGFADWVDGLHNYRHGQPSDQPVAPKEEVAVYVLSSGSAFLRWLIGINADLTTQGKADQDSSS